jgi:predicted aminopeptidase
MGRAPTFYDTLVQVERKPHHEPRDMKLSRIIPRCAPCWPRARAGLLASCSTLNYYTQAAQGQLELLSDARPIDDWLADPGTSSKLRLRLETARQIRRFAVAEMALPDNNSYKNYAALKRKYVLWNVVATPELSLKPCSGASRWPAASTTAATTARDAAEAYARELRADGNDVEVGGVPAYSTLGWFSDPLISTFINYPDAELARMIFHELAHQVVYVPGDSQFNESFASTVEEVGVERWLERFGNQAMREAMRATGPQAGFPGAAAQVPQGARTELRLVDRSDNEKRAVKARLFMELKDEYQVLKATGAAMPATTASSPAAVERPPGLDRDLRRLRAGLPRPAAREGSFPRFYRGQAPGRAGPQERHRILKALAPPVPTAPLMVQRSETRRKRLLFQLL